MNNFFDFYSPTLVQFFKILLMLRILAKFIGVIERFLYFSRFSLSNHFSLRIFNLNKFSPFFFRIFYMKILNFVLIFLIFQLFALKSIFFSLISPHIQRFLTLTMNGSSYVKCKRLNQCRFFNLIFYSQKSY